MTRAQALGVPKQSTYQIVRKVKTRELVSHLSSPFLSRYLDRSSIHPFKLETRMLWTKVQNLSQMFFSRRKKRFSKAPLGFAKRANNTLFRLDNFGQKSNVKLNLVKGHFKALAWLSYVYWERSPSTEWIWAKLFISHFIRSHTSITENAEHRIFDVQEVENLMSNSMSN